MVQYLKMRELTVWELLLEIAMKILSWAIIFCGLASREVAQKGAAAEAICLCLRQGWRYYISR